MHLESFELMTLALQRRPATVLRSTQQSMTVLDVASLDINGTYREMVEALGYAYTGLDIVEGPNVDIVAHQPYNYPFAAETFDAVICGNAMHNMAAFWLVVPEMVRVLKSDGLIVLVAPTWNKSKAGKYPIDAWRFMEDGLRVLFDMTGQLHEYVITESGMDIVGSAIKK